MPILVLGLIACGNDGVSADAANTSRDRAVAAVELAEQETGGTAFELDEEGSSGWDVEVAVNSDVIEVRVNREGTQVTNTRNDGRMDLDDARRLQNASVALADAITTAAGEAPGLVQSAELGRFRVTTLVWSVELEDGADDIEVSIDAATGAVVNVDRD